MSFHEHEADVLVVGGGISGCMAACAAAEKGVQVTMVNKGTLRSGGSARPGFQGGILLFPREEINVYSSAGEGSGTWKPQDIEKFWASMEIQVEGLLDEELTRYMAERSWEVLPKLESYGVKTTTKSLGDEYMWTVVYDIPQLSFDDWDMIQPRLGAQVAKFDNIDVFERMMTVDLVMDGDEARGVIAMDIRTGDIHVFHSKTVILATGSTCRLYESASGIPYNTRYSPYNTGDGQALALRAGGELANMEIVYWSLCPKDFEFCGTTWSTKMGAIWKNAKGEAIMEKHFPKDKQGVQRHLLVKAVIEEINARNDPILLDFTPIPEAKIRAVWDHICYPVKEYYESRGIDLRKAPVEYVPHGDCTMVGGVSGGITVNMDLRSSLQRVYAAGNCSCSGFESSPAACFIGGIVAGENAAAASEELPLKKGDKETINRLVDFIREPLNRDKGIRPDALENNLRKIMSSYVGYGRNEKGLTIATERIKSLKELLNGVMADDAHGLMKFLELRNLLDLGQGIAGSARFRTESRIIPMHYRSDFPEKNDAEWYGKRVAAKLENDEFTFYKIPTL